MIATLHRTPLRDNERDSEMNLRSLCLGPIKNYNGTGKPDFESIPTIRPDVHCPPLNISHVARARSARSVLFESISVRSVVPAEIRLVLLSTITSNGSRLSRATRAITNNVMSKNPKPHQPSLFMFFNQPHRKSQIANRKFR